MKGTRPPNIFLCILLDIIGYASFAIPGPGEFSDIVWAPLAAFLYLKIFKNKTARVGAAVTFIEELLPFTDFIPTFTITWLLLEWRKTKPKPVSI